MFRPILNKIGFDQLELVICAGAPLPPETMALWQMLGVNVVEMYGQTETAGGIISGQRGPFPRPGDVGTVPEGWEVQLRRTARCWCAAPICSTATGTTTRARRRSRTDDGWLRTGDVGEWRDGALRLIDRARDFIVTSGGKTISPSFIENIVARQPLRRRGRRVRPRPQIPDRADRDRLRHRRRLGAQPRRAYTGFTSLVGNAEVAKLIGAEIEKANGELARVEQIKAFRILPKALDPEEEGEPVTPTRKVKRT